MSIIVGTPDGKTAEFPDGTDPAIIKSVMAKQFGAPKPADPTSAAAFNPTANTSGLENFAAGIGQGASDLDLGASQFVMHHPALAGALGISTGMIGSSPENIKKLDDAAKEKAQIDKDLLGTTGGKLGSVIEQGALLAPIGAVAAPSSVAGLAASGALQGGIAGAVQPVAGDYNSQNLSNIAQGAAVGGITSGAVGAASKAIQAALNPTRTAMNVAGYAPKVVSPDQAALAQAAQRQGIDLTQGQIMGGAAAKLEDAARKSVASADIVKQADQKIIGQWEGSVQNLMDNIYSGDTSNAATRIQGAVKQATSALQSAREAAASQDYGAIRQLAQGQTKFIAPQNYMQTLDQLTEQFAGAPKGSDYAKIAGALDDLRGSALQNADLQTLMKTRRYLSQVASGATNIVGDTGRSTQKFVASKLLGAIDGDLQTSADAVGGPIGDMLKQANARYANFSQKIEGLKNSAAGKLLGDDFVDAMGNGTFNSIPPETVINRLSSMQPSQIQAAKGIIQQTDPDAWQAFKRATIQGLFDNANSPAKFATATTEGKGITSSRLRALLDPQEYSALQDIGKVSRAIGSQAYANTSGTAGAQETFNFLHAAGALATGNVKPAAAMAASALGSRQVADLMLNSDAQPILRKLTTVGPGTTAFSAYLNQLRGLAGQPEPQLPAAAGQ